MTIYVLGRRYGHARLPHISALRFACFALGFGVLSISAAPSGAQSEQRATDPAFQEVVRQYAGRPKPQLPEEVRRFKIQAEAAIKQKDFDEAIRSYAEALKLAPWWPEGYYNSAIIIGELGRHSEAISSMRRFIDLEPGTPAARNGQDRIYQWEYLAKKADVETTAWDAIKDSKSAEDIRAYLEKYPSGKFASAANARLKALASAEGVAGVWTMVSQNGSQGHFKFRAEGAGQDFKMYASAPGRESQQWFRGSISGSSVTGAYLPKNVIRNVMQCGSQSPKIVCNFPDEYPLSGELSKDGKQLQLRWDAPEISWNLGFTSVGSEKSRQPNTATLVRGIPMQLSAPIATAAAANQAEIAFKPSGSMEDALIAMLLKKTTHDVDGCSDPNFPYRSFWFVDEHALRGELRNAKAVFTRFELARETVKYLGKADGLHRFALRYAAEDASGKSMIETVMETDLLTKRRTVTLTRDGNSVLRDGKSTNGAQEPFLLVCDRAGLPAVPPATLEGLLASLDQIAKQAGPGKFEVQDGLGKGTTFDVSNELGAAKGCDIQIKTKRETGGFFGVALEYITIVPLSQIDSSRSVVAPGSWIRPGDSEPKYSPDPWVVFLSTAGANAITFKSTGMVAFETLMSYARLQFAKRETAEEWAGALHRAAMLCRR